MFSTYKLYAICQFEREWKTVEKIFHVIHQTCTLGGDTILDAINKQLTKANAAKDVHRPVNIIVKPNGDWKTPLKIRFKTLLVLC